MTRYRPAREGRRARRDAQVRELGDVKLAAAVHGLRGPTQDGNWSTCCPFCARRVQREDKEYKLTIKISGATATSPDHPEGIPLSPEFGVWHCYRCHARGFADFRWMLADLPAPDPAAPPPVEVPVDLGPPPGFATIADCERSFSMRWVPEYFASRGVLVAARIVGAGGCASGRFEGRVVVPHLGVKDGPWLGFSARLVRGREGAPKYLYPRGMDRRAALWGLPWIAPVGPVLIVEGVFDALPVFPNAVATFGTAVTEAQLDALVALRCPLVACLDGDAWEKCRELARRLTLRGADARWCHLPPDSDPGTLGLAVWGLVQPRA